MPGGLRDSEIDFVLKTSTEGDAAYDRFIAQLKGSQLAADDTNASLGNLGERSNFTAQEVEKMSQFLERNRDVMKQVQGDADTTGTFLGALAASAGMSREEFDKHSQSLLADLGMLDRHQGSVENNRSAIQRMIADYRDGQAVSSALGAAVGATGREFEELAADVFKGVGATTDLSTAMGGKGGGGLIQSLAGATAGMGPLGTSLVVLAPLIAGLVVVIVPIIAMIITWIAVTATLVVSMVAVIALFATAAFVIGGLGVAVALLADNYFTVTQATKGTIDPLLQLETHAKNAALALGQQAYPMLVLMANAANAMVDPIAKAASAMIAWFGERLPAMLKIAGQWATDFSIIWQMLGTIYAQVVDYALSHAPQFESFFLWLAVQVIGALLGLFQNLERLANWFFSNWVPMTQIAGDGMDQLGNAIQFVASVFKGWVEWSIGVWPTLTAVVRGAIDEIRKNFGFIGDGIQILMPVIKLAIDTLGNSWSLLSAQIQEFTKDSNSTYEVMRALGYIIGALIVVLVLAAAALIALVAASVAVEAAFGRLISLVVEGAGPAFSAMDNDFQVTMIHMSGSLLNFHQLVTTSFHTVWSDVQSFLHSVYGAIDNDAQVTMTHISGTLLNFNQLASATFHTVWSDIQSFLGSINSTIYNTIVSVWSAITSAIVSWLGQQASIIQSIWNSIWALLGSILNAIRETITAAWNAIYTIIATTLATITAIIAAGLGLQSAQIQSTWNNIQAFLSGAMSNLRAAVDSGFHGAYDTVAYWSGLMAQKVSDTFTAMVTGIGAAMNAIGSAVHGDLENARNILDNFIHVANKTLHLSIGDLPEFARGGTLPGYSPGQDTVIARLSPGEGVLTPQAVRSIGGASAVHALNSLPGFALGGIVGSLLGGAETTANNAFGGLGNFSGTLAGGAGKMVLDNLGSWIGSNIGGFFTALVGGGGGVPSANVSGNLAQWIAAAIAATGVGANWAPGLAVIIQNESGGNPGAANNWDINAQRGDPSVGLMQLTLSNQARYGGVTMDPVLQIVEGIKYIIDRYGDIGRVPGVASVSAGGAYLPYDTGGWLMPGGKAINMSGRPEYISSPGQSAQGPGGVHYHFHTVGTLSSEMVREAQRLADWEARTGAHARRGELLK